MISIVIPTHDMKNGKFFLERALQSIRSQSYQDFEIIITKTGKGMAVNTNKGIKQAKGELIKILFMDDYLAHKDALKDIVKNFKGNWLVTGCEHDNGTRNRPHMPRYNANIYLGNNTIGSPSVLTIKNDKPILFDENLQWLIDCDYYKRLYELYGAPTVLEDINVVIGIHNGQQTNLLSDDIKREEEKYVKNKFA